MEGLPTLNEITEHERYQNLDASRQAYVLNLYKNDVLKELSQDGLFKDEAERKQAFERVNREISARMPSGNSLDAMGDALFVNPGHEMVAEFSGMVATNKEANTKRSVRDAMHRAQIAQAQFGDTFSVENFRPNTGIDEKALDEHAKKKGEWYEQLRQGAEANIAEDKDRIGNALIQQESGALSLSGLGSAANRMGADLLAGTAANIVAPGVGPFAYYANAGIARSDRSQRLGNPERGAEERQGRSAGVGLVSGSLEAVGFGWITGTSRIAKAQKLLSNSVGGKIAGAALAEGLTEFSQSLVESVGHNAEAFDDVVTILSDPKVLKQALEEAALGSILGGTVRGGVEVSPKAIEAITKTETYKNAVQKLADVKAKVDVKAQESIYELGKRVQEWKNEFDFKAQREGAVSQLGQDLVGMKAQAMEADKIASKKQAESDFAQEKIQEVEDLETGKFKAESVPTPETMDGEFANYTKADILKAHEVDPIDSSDFVPELTREQKIRQAVIENGGIMEDPFHKDNIRTPEGKLAFSPRFQAGKDSGHTIDIMLDLLKEDNTLPPDATSDDLILALQGKIKKEETEVSDEVIDEMEAEYLKNNVVDETVEDEGYVPEELFDATPTSSFNSSKEPVTEGSGDDRTLLPLPRERVKVDELPLSLSQLTEFSGKFLDKPASVKKLIRRNPNIRGSYTPATLSIDLKAGLAAGPEVRIYREKLSKDQVIEDLLEDENIKFEFPDLNEDNLIVLENGLGGVTAHIRDHKYAAKVLAHEIGHMIDDIDAKELTDKGEFVGVSGRGNLLGRLQGIKKFLKGEVLAGDGTIKNSVVRKELRALTHWWKPFNSQANSNYTKYRYSGPELYADAISVMFNAPNELASRAPQFYKGFKAFLDKKPMVKKHYEALLEARQKGNVAEHNLGRVTDMMKEAAKAKPSEGREGFLQRIKNLFIDVSAEVVDTRMHHRIYKREKKVSDKVFKKFSDTHSDFLHSSVSGQGYFLNQKKFAQEMDEMGITQADFDSYMFLKLTADQRKDFFNPLGLRGNESAKTLDALKAKMGSDFSKLERLQKKFNKSRKVALDVIIDSGIFSPELQEYARSNDNYVSFDVKDDDFKSNYSDHYSSPVMKVVGTLSDLKRSPFEKTVKQDFALMHLAYLNKAKKSLVEDLILPDDRQAASRGVDGKFKEYNGKDKKLFTYLDGGKLKGFYIDSNLAALYDGSPRTAQLIKHTAVVIQPLKDIWIKYSPAFGIKNLPRDFEMGWKQLGSTFNRTPAPLRPFVQGFMFASEYIRSMPEVFKTSFLDKHSDYLVDMAIKGELNLSDPGGINYEKDFDSELMKDFEHILGEAHKDKNIIKRSFNRIAQFSKFTEILPRVAGRRLLEKYSNLSERDINIKMREFASPDFLDGGHQRSLLNVAFVFSNASQMGVRQNFKAAKEDPFGYFVKSAVLHVAPVVSAWMAMSGYFGEDEENFYSKVDENDIKHSIIIPLGLSEEGEAQYIKIPQDHFGAMFGQLTWSALNKDGGEAVSALTGQIPWWTDNVNPAARIALETANFASGRSPVDHYNNKVVDDGLVGNFPIIFEEDKLIPSIEEGWKDFGAYQWNSLMGSHIKFDSKDDLGVSRFPFVTSIVNAAYKKTDKGITQKEMRDYRERKAGTASFIAESVSDLPNSLTLNEVEEEAGLAFESYEGTAKWHTFKRAFVSRYKRKKRVQY